MQKFKWVKNTVISSLACRRLTSYLLRSTRPGAGSAISKLFRTEQSVKIFTSEYSFFIYFSSKGNRFEDLLKEVRVF